MKDLYDVIGVTKQASKDEIKRSYRKVAMKFHPDKNPGDTQAEQKFKEAAEAYSILSDDQKRAQYDQFGHAGVGLGDQGRGGHQGFGGIHMSMDDIFDQFGDIFGGSPFESFFGGGQSRRSRSRGTDIKIKLKISFEEILSGGEKKIKYKRRIPDPETSFITCRNCQGTGQVTRVSQSFLGAMRSTSVCPHCNGTGKQVGTRSRKAGPDGLFLDKQTIVVKIPSGIEDGNYMTFDGKGHFGHGGANPGDLIILFEEISHQYFTRNERDVFIEVHLTFSQAALGDKIQIPTLEGKASLTIPAGIQSGQILRMKRKGFPKLRGGNRGDQLVRIQLKTPQSVNKKEKNLFTQLSELKGNNEPTFSKVKL
jgi:molecular chaperone DnaJ